MHGIRGRLKVATEPAHARVEAALGLLDPALSPVRLGQALATMYGFWVPAEDALTSWAAQSSELAADLDWPRRCRVPRLRADLNGLGIDPDTVAVAAARPPADDAHALAWLYVAEGSTLGGAVIARSLRTHTPTAVTPISFVPYAEGPGPMWRRFLTVLERWAADDTARADDVVAAAVAVFGDLAAWVQGAPAEAVA